MRFFTSTVAIALGALTLPAAPLTYLGAPPEPSASTPTTVADAAQSHGLSGVSDLAVDITNRADVVAFWNSEYQASQGVAAGWTGSVDDCEPGTTTQAYLDATARRINFFRAMAGLPGNITLDPELNAKSQAAALIMIAQGSLSHNPPQSWECWSADGNEAAGNSNIALGAHGPRAIDLYINDPGGGNAPVGHRRWILYPRQLVMGSGSTDARNGFYTGSNNLWVFGTWTDRPASPLYVTWPPPGFVPHQIVYPRWSFSMPGANFTAANVTMTRGSDSIDLNIISRNGGYGDPTIVWEPNVPSGAPAQDTVYSVTVSNVSVGGSLQDFAYNVTVIDPNFVPNLPEPSEIVDFLLGLGPDTGNLDVNGDQAIDSADVVMSTHGH